MPLNIPGILVPFQLLIYPRLVIPSIVVKDIRQLDFPALKRAGYRGAVFDKDNCLTLPHRDTLVPGLEESWKSCRETFGEGNVLIVSNSAGTRLDAGGIQSESVQHHLQVPVLFHQSLKPAYSCITAIRTYFASLPFPISQDELIVVGDRVFTDVVMANRIRMQRRGRKQASFLYPFDKKGESHLTESGDELYPTSPVGPLSIWTTGVWERESMVMRWIEKSLVNVVDRWSTSPHGESLDTTVFLKEVPSAPKQSGLIEKLWLKLRD